MAKKTIAIIGATGGAGITIAKALAKANFRLLLFGDDRKKLTSLAEQIRVTNPAVDVDCMYCAADASWEADIIIPAVPFIAQKEIAKKIEPYTNRKIVISIPDLLIGTNENLGTTSCEELQRLLPGARIVKAFDAPSIKSFQPVIDGKQSISQGAFDEEKSLQAILEILKIAELN